MEQEFKTIDEIMENQPERWPWLKGPRQIATGSNRIFVPHYKNKDGRWVGTDRELYRANKKRIWTTRPGTWRCCVVEKPGHPSEQEISDAKKRGFTYRGKDSQGRWEWELVSEK